MSARALARSTRTRAAIRACGKTRSRTSPATKPRSRCTAAERTTARARASARTSATTPTLPGSATTSSSPTRFRSTRTRSSTSTRPRPKSSATAAGRSLRTRSALARSQRVVRRTRAWRAPVHETWCASYYHDEAGPRPCDCRAAERVRPKAQWRGELPDQFCEKCEGFPVRLIIVRPRPDAESQSLRFFAACFVPGCAHIRELDQTAVVDGGKK